MKKSIHYLLMADHLLFQKEIFSMLKDTGLTYGQPKILDYLLYHNGALQKDIAKACHIEPATLTSLLTGMENHQLIERKRLNGNRRNIYVYLSNKGETLAKQIAVNFKKIERQALADFSEAEENTLIELLSKLNEGAKKRGTEE